VYIREAHACDVWPIGDAFSNGVTAPRSDSDRCGLVARLRTELHFQPRLLADPIDDPFERAFSPWPLRFYLLNSTGVLAFKSMPEGASHDITKFEAAVRDALQ